MIKTIIQAIYHPESPLPHEELDYIKALEEIEHSKVFSQIYFLLKEKGLLEKTPSFFQDRLKIGSQETLFQSIYIKNQTDQILKLFEQESISVIPLKGVVFTEKYFGHLSARGTSDIDLLVMIEDMERAIEHIKSLGFSKEEPSAPFQFHRCFSKIIPGSPLPLTVELHWNLLREKTSDLDINEFWKAAIPYKEFTHVRQLSDFHTFYLICLHGWRSNMSSYKYFIDIIQLMKKMGPDLNLPYLIEKSRQHKTSTRIIKVFSILYGTLPFMNDLERLPFKRKKSIFWRESILQPDGDNRFPSKMRRWLHGIEDYDSLKHSIVGLYLKLGPIINFFKKYTKIKRPS